MAPLTGFFAVSFALQGQPTYANSRSLSSSRTSFSASTSSDDVELSTLCTLFGASPSDLLSLKTNEDGIRGVFLDRSVEEGEDILKIPLDSCLRDDDPPDWLRSASITDEINDSYVVVEEWVSRLTASLLEMQLSESKSEGQKLWLDLLPTNLHELLPIHWNPEVVASTQSRSLELAVDSAFFSRSSILGDLMLKRSDLTKEQFEMALDLVQTRSCRIESDTGRPLRVLVPIFDLINHARDHNAEFVREGDFLVVRARRDIAANSEIFISYGGSTQPAWKCLFSYGFVPNTEDIYEDDEAEIVVEGSRFVVNPTEVPFELVELEAEKLGLPTGDDFELTPEMGSRIVDHILDAAKELHNSSGKEVSDKDTSAKLVDDLRRSNWRTLRACAGGLKEYIESIAGIKQY